MNDLTSLLTYILVVTFTPGPNNIMAMVNGMRNGYGKTLRFLLGIACGFLIIMLCAGILNIALASLIPSSDKWLKILGAIYMLYLAYHVARSGPIEEGKGENAADTFWFGFGMQFLNVKGILYGISVTSLFLSDISREPVHMLLFAVLLALIAFAAVSSWAIGGNLFRSVARKHYKAINYLMGALLVYTAVASLF
jgi:cysteine/O-acetylserine efflux protein